MRCATHQLQRHDAAAAAALDGIQREGLRNLLLLVLDEAHDLLHVDACAVRE